MASGSGELADMQPKSAWLELRPLGSLSVRLHFAWCGDRYAHCLELTRDGQSLVGLRSLEGADHETWPASPALQQLNLQTSGAGRSCALLLGMAGKNHWSASVETRADRLVFDIACRVQEPAGWLGSSYQIDPSCDRVSQQPDGSYHLAYGGDDRPSAVRIVADQGMLAYERQLGRISVRPRPMADRQTEGARWGYVMQWIASDDASHEGAGP